MNYAAIKLKIEEKQNRLINEFLTQKSRPHFDQIDLSSRGTLLVGPRGVGKTTLLIRELKNAISMQGHGSAFYISLDDVNFQNIDLVDFVDKAYSEGLRSIYLDEVHYRLNWSFEIKNLYDSYPKLKIIISDSNSLILRTGNADLSRRFPMTKLPLLSFREFIYFKKNILLPRFNPFNAYSNKHEFILPAEIQEFKKNENINLLFSEFINRGQRPFFIETKYSERILALIDKTVYSDIPYYVPSIQKTHLATLKSVISYLSSSSIPTINIQNLCSQWAIGKEKAYELIFVLESAGLLNIIYNTLTPKGASKGDKMLFNDCSFYSALEGSIGGQREAYFCSALLAGHFKVITSSDETRADYKINNFYIEVGGKSKSIKKADIVIREFQEDIFKNQWPLWLIGFLW